MMETRKIGWMENFCIATTVLLTLLSFTSRLIQSILGSLDGSGSRMEYLLLSAYVLPALIILGLVKDKSWAYLATGIWCAVSAVLILMTILFTPVGGAIRILAGQFILVLALSGTTFYLWKKKRTNTIFLSR